MTELTHIGPDGRARMVDVSDKADTARVELRTATFGSPLRRLNWQWGAIRKKVTQSRSLSSLG